MFNEENSEITNGNIDSNKLMIIGGEKLKSKCKSIGCRFTIEIIPSLMCFFVDELTFPVLKMFVEFV